MELLLPIIVTFVLTWTLRTAIRWWWFPSRLITVEVPTEKQKTLKGGYVPGDPKHYWTKCGGLDLAYTDSDNSDALKRADRLKAVGVCPPRRSFWKLLLCLQ